MAEYDNKVALGSSITQLVTLIKNALTGKQNTLTAGSGIDITNDVISSTGGGSSLPTDPSTDGSYKLVNTVETDSETQEQTGTLSWEENKEYTAGAGIEIDNGVIKNTTVGAGVLYGFTSGTGNVHNYLGVYRGQQTTKNAFWKTLKNGELVSNVSYAPTYQDAYENGIVIVINVYGYNFTTARNYINIDNVTSSSTGFLPNQGGVFYLYQQQSGMTLITFPNTIQLRYAMGGDLFDAIIGKNTYVNFSGFRLRSYIDGIDNALTARIPDNLVSTETTPSTNNTINWLYE